MRSMALTTRRSVAVALTAAGLAATLPIAVDAATGGGAAPNLSSGRAVFVQFCGKCHALQAAGSHGTLGPNLDVDHVSFARIITAIEEGVGGIQAEYVLRHVTFSQVYDVARYVVSARAASGVKPTSPDN